MYTQVFSVAMFCGGLLSIIFNKRIAQWTYGQSKPGLDSYSSFLSKFKLGFLSPSEKYEIKLRRFGAVFSGIILILWALGNLFGPITV